MLLRITVIILVLVVNIVSKGKFPRTKDTLSGLRKLQPLRYEASFERKFVGSNCKKIHQIPSCFPSDYKDMCLDITNNKKAARIYQLAELMKTIRFTKSWFIKKKICSSRTNGYDEAISEALEVLEVKDLPVIQRIWALGTLQVLLSHLSYGERDLVQMDLKEGPVCRAALELSLLRGIDLFDVVRGGWEKFENYKVENTILKSESIDAGLIEPLQRVDLLVKINQYHRPNEGSSYEAFFPFSIHDGLLFASHLLKQTLPSNFVHSCLQYISLDFSSYMARKFTFEILQHLQNFSNHFMSEVYLQRSKYISYDRGYKATELQIKFADVWEGSALALAHQNSALLCNAQDYKAKFWVILELEEYSYFSSIQSK
ncbi:hypothetical protein CROQUDRAFT_131172 [Cronartium quercuum f. sp. fusiforme G11]|uniref:Uncharacterized protein n=1 Tax=Cronartium quercuum f. sp. fusiforme G11 TaxID=708437 RepID=A0A9P6NPA5_9BASI|nr:hypothetical protein CROQUDRAFT_131172 [Cronartium quercuum f. sp. fusiforme G11]